MGCESGRYKTSAPYRIFIVTLSLEGLPTKAKETPSPHEVTLVLLDTNPVFQCLRVIVQNMANLYTKIALNCIILKVIVGNDNIHV